MESIGTIIQNTNIKSEKDFELLANKLIRNYCIKCGDTEYRFAEIEFYYYKDDNNSLNNEWNQKTYPRNANAGNLFFHYSGVDICFESNINDGYFGGILIRSLLDDKRKRYITGPLLCANEILNSCSSKKVWPKIEPTSKLKCEIGVTKRYGITYSSNNTFDDKLCYFEKRLKETLKNTFEDVMWDYTHHRPKDITRNYTKRFNDGE
jgi:hypothetical protein